MSRALQATKRPMLFSMCDWGLSQPWLYGPQVGAPTTAVLLQALYHHATRPLPHPSPPGSQASQGIRASVGVEGSRTTTRRIEPFPKLSLQGRCWRAKNNSTTNNERPGVQIAHSWRVTKDISLGDDPRVRWGEVLENLDNAARLARFAGPGGWNDLGAPQQHEPVLVECEPAGCNCAC